MTALTKEYLEAEQAAIKLVESTLATRKAILFQDKIQFGNDAMAARGIEIGGKVDIVFTGRAAPKSGTAFFFGYVKYGWGLSVEPKFLQVKKNGEASQREFNTYHDYDVSPAKEP